jgi:hypothetical protein
MQAWRYEVESGRGISVRLAFNGPEKCVIGRVSWSDDTVWIDAVKPKKSAAEAKVVGTVGFRGVPEDVWHFHIGGYQVCEKWLKDRRGRTLTADDITHYYRIVIALHQTIRIMRDRRGHRGSRRLARRVRDRPSAGGGRRMISMGAFADLLDRSRSNLHIEDGSWIGAGG